MASFEWVGQGDAAGDWMDGNAVYVGNFTNAPTGTIVIGGAVPPLFGGPGGINFFGLTWLKNVAVLMRDYWDPSLTTPYSGQLFPVPNTGGTQTGQIYPF